VKQSDISGRLLADEDAVSVVVRRHPRISGPRQFDAAREELAALRPVEDLVALELTMPGGDIEALTCTVAEFDRVIGAEVLRNAQGTRGRRRGFRPR